MFCLLARVQNIHSGKLKRVIPVCPLTPLQFASGLPQQRFTPVSLSIPDPYLIGSQTTIHQYPWLRSDLSSSVEEYVSVGNRLKVQHFFFLTPKCFFERFDDFNHVFAHRWEESCAYSYCPVGRWTFSPVGALWIRISTGARVRFSGAFYWGETLVWPVPRYNPVSELWSQLYWPHEFYCYAFSVVGLYI